MGPRWTDGPRRRPFKVGGIPWATLDSMWQDLADPDGPYEFCCDLCHSRDLLWVSITQERVILCAACLLLAEFSRILRRAGG